MNKFFPIVLALLFFSCDEGASNLSKAANKNETKKKSPKSNKNKTETFEQQLNKINGIRNWYVGYIWNEGINDIKSYLKEGTNSIGEKFDVEFCIRNLNKELKKLNDYNQYINNLDGKIFSDIKYSWNKMHNKIIEIQGWINSHSITPNFKGAIFEASILNQYFDAFDRSMEELEQTVNE